MKLVSNEIDMQYTWSKGPFQSGYFQLLSFLYSNINWCFEVCIRTRIDWHKKNCPVKCCFFFIKQIFICKIFWPRVPTSKITEGNITIEQFDNLTTSGAWRTYGEGPPAKHEVAAGSIPASDKYFQGVLDVFHVPTTKNTILVVHCIKYINCFIAASSCFLDYMLFRRVVL